MVAINSAVAGIEPVEPAAITGPLVFASRAVSALMSASRRAAGSIAPRSARIFGQALTRDLEEIERELPVPIEVVGNEVVEPIPRDAACGHVVHEAGEIIGQCQRRGRIVGDERGFARRPRV